MLVASSSRYLLQNERTRYGMLSGKTPNAGRADTDANKEIEYVRSLRASTRSARLSSAVDDRPRSSARRRRRSLALEHRPKDAPNGRLRRRLRSIRRMGLSAGLGR